MITKLAALGLGVATAVAPTVALAADCAPAHPDSSYPTPTYPTYPSSTYPGSYPASTYPSYPSYGAPVPVYSPTWNPTPLPPVPPPPARRTVLLKRADYNGDGGITFTEAQAYGRTEFGYADVDRNGVLTRRELDNHVDEFARGARHRGRGVGVVTFAEYDMSVRHRFIDLDRNRDGFVSRYEIEGRPEPKTVRVSWHWQL